MERCSQGYEKKELLQNNDLSRKSQAEDEDDEETNG